MEIWYTTTQMQGEKTSKKLAGKKITNEIK
jgi:hypothetical protein